MAMDPPHPSDVTMLTPLRRSSFACSSGGLSSPDSVRMISPRRCTLEEMHKSLCMLQESTSSLDFPPLLPSRLQSEHEVGDPHYHQDRSTIDEIHTFELPPTISPRNRSISIRDNNCIVVPAWCMFQDSASSLDFPPPLPSRQSEHDLGEPHHQDRSTSDENHTFELPPTISPRNRSISIRDNNAIVPVWCMFQKSASSLDFPPQLPSRLQSEHEVDGPVSDNNAIVDVLLPNSPNNKRASFTYSRTVGTLPRAGASMRRRSSPITGSSSSGTSDNEPSWTATRIMPSRSG
ncbi:hypothetical protein IV203_019817 [Nitzschia inconspicua]|uniref:Uncharacterized protein n=1 Tax=Nitzschia inconspicua TaxID=303405 RepID=A0A9K3K5E5_9STRA|nr:hypothetical protein IV203_020386 [Nitzschia inconspicua]KAG7371247.1 hypothetical protein IV203_019817 [Nitzschia inconspicua]